MPDTVEPEILVNSILGKVSDVLINGDGTVIPKSDDHFLAFMSPGVPLLESDFNYALEGFGGVYRRNADADDLAGSTGPQPAAPADGGGGVADQPSADELMAQDARQKYAAAESFYNLVDMVPDMSGIIDAQRINNWNPEAQVSHVYAQALQHSQVYDNQPDAATQAKIERWRSKLVTTRKEKDIITDEEVEVTEESEIVKRYNEKMLGFLGAAGEYNNTRISALAGKDQEAVHRMAINGPLMQLKVRAAMNDWSGYGHKGDVDRLNAAIQSVEDRAFVLLKQRYKEDYFRSLLTNPSSGSNFPYCAPASPSFARSESGWSEFYFNSGSFASNHSFRSTSTQAGGGFSIGIFGGSGGGSVEKKRWEGKLSTKSFNMRFKLARVPIARPWFRLDYLMSGYWRFDASNQVVSNTMISDGNKTNPGGLMPAITTDLILIKDLYLDFGEYDREFKQQSTAVSGGGTAHVGPFFAGGRHSSVNRDRQVEANWEGQGIHIPGLQLLGYVCFQLPKSPNPKPGIDSWI